MHWKKRQIIHYQNVESFKVAHYTLKRFLKLAENFLIMIDSKMAKNWAIQNKKKCFKNVLQ